MARTKTIDSVIGGKKPSLSQSKESKKSINITNSIVKKRFKPGTLALREIRKYQKSSDLLIRKRPFQRLLRSLASVNNMDFRFQAAAIIIFQEAVENFLTNLFEDSYKCALHAKRVTLLPRDILLIYKIKYSKNINTMMI